MEVIRLVGGPHDGATYYGSRVCGNLHVVKSRPIPIFLPEDGLPLPEGVDQGIYVSTGFADEDGNEMFFWSGWICQSHE